MALKCSSDVLLEEIEEMNERITSMDTEIAIRKRRLAEKRKKLKRVQDAKQKLIESSINRSSSSRGSPPCKRRLTYDNPNEETDTDNANNIRITQPIAVDDESLPSTSQETDESFIMPTTCLKDNLDTSVLSTSEKVDLTLMEKTVHDDSLPSTFQETDETFVMSTTCLKDNLDTSVLSTPEKVDLTLMEKSNTAVTDSVVGKWLQCYMCKKNQRRTPKKMRTPDKESSDDKWLCKKCARVNAKCARTNALVKCDLCEKSTGNKFIMVFNKERYNLNNNYVKKSIEKLDDHSVKYHICSTCDKKLIQRSMSNCALCRKVCVRRDLREMKGPFKLSEDLIQEKGSKEKLLICVQCKGELTDKVKCVACDELKSKNDTRPFKKDRYWPNKLVETIVGGSECDRICQVCDRSLMRVYTCTCCHKRFNKSSIMVFQDSKYDMANYVVSCALARIYRYTDEAGEYICTQCDKSLSAVNGGPPQMPRRAIARKLKDPGHKFLQAIREKPEFVCTCCHRWLFRRSVIEYSEVNYNMQNTLVAKTLDKKYRHQMEVIVIKGIRSAHEHPVDYGPLSDSENSESDSDIGETNCLDNVMLKRYEYICRTCHNKLRKKNPEMPAQACANGLELAPIPPELQNLSDLERKLIALRIPFMVIFCMLRYGSQYKARGGCTNVPTTLKQIVNLLPRMSSEVQYHPMKLKKKMVYKSHFMYSFIRKDVVIAAIKWLKENNGLYADVDINENWADEWVNSELSSFVDDHDKDSVTENDKATFGESHNACTGITISGKTSSEVTKSGRVSCKHRNGNRKKGHAKDSVEENEFREDCNAAEKALLTTGQPTANMLQFEQLENEIYTCAPGEDNIPQYILLDDEFEVLAYPDMFPYGKGGFKSSGARTTKLSLRKYYQQRLLNVDGRFANNIEYLFCAQYATEIKQIKDSTQIALRLKRGKTLGGKTITAGMLKNTSIVSKLVHTEQAYKFLRQVRGSPAYWQHELYELLAMLRCLGIPTWFLTLSAADLHWVEMLETIAIHKHLPISRKDIKNMSIKERSEKLKANPIQAVGLFQYRVESFFTHYITGNNNPVGHVKEYAIKIEFQERGSPHAHCLLWVEDAPKIDVDDDSVICKFIDRYVSGVVPCDSEDTKQIRELVTKFETHSHSSYCRRNHSCRFGFPKAPAIKTVICREPDDSNTAEKVLENSCNILSKVHEVIDRSTDERPMTLAAILEEVKVTPAEYMSAVKVTRRGRSVILKRNPSDAYTNGCNHEILRLWGANVDFQFVLDEYSTIMYVCSYMMKSEKAMGEVLKHVAKECRSDPIEQQLKKIGKAFVGHRVVGAPEAAMRELSMWLMKKSRKVTFVNSNMKDDRVSLPKSNAALEKMNADEDDVYMTSIHDRYAARPNILEDLCLAKFAVNYEVLTGGTKEGYEEKNIYDDNDADGDDDGIAGNCVDDTPVRKCQPTIKLKNGLGGMRKRQKEAILRVTSFRKGTEPENYYHARLLLYLPWRSEDNLLGGYETYQEHYNEVMDMVETNAKQFHLHNEIMDNAISHVAENGLPEIAWDAIAPMVEEENTHAKNDDCVVIQNNVDEDGDEDSHINDLDAPADGGDSADSRKSKLSVMFSREARKDIMPNNEYRYCVRHLNPCQKRIVMFNRKWCKDYIASLRTGGKTPSYQVFLNGPGGTGKSHIIKLIRRDVIYFLQKTMKVEPDQPIVLLTAPTGLAAFNIGGVTLHSAFMLRTSNDCTETSGWEKKSTMQVKLRNLALCVIDEISMVGTSTFQKICSALKKIKQSTDDWGGVSILAVGDFFQLPPVGQCQLFKRTSSVRTPGDLAPLLWDNFLRHDLTDVMRQRDIQFSTALNYIRMNVPEKGSSEDKMLQSRELYLSPRDDGYPIDAMHVYAQNAYCTEWNNTRLDQLGTVLYSCTAQDFSKDRNTNLASITFPSNPRDTGNLLSVFNVKVGARVMLTTNIDVCDGLTNGVMGTVSGVIEKKGKLHVILVKFDSNSVGVSAKENSIHKNLFPDAVPIGRIEVSFSVTKRCHVRVSRTQFPLFLCWAVTIHKCQGMTLPEIVVDMSREKGRYREGQAYVAFSRVTQLAKLHIVNYTREQIRVSSSVKEEMSRCDVTRVPEMPVPFVLTCNKHDNLCICHLNIQNLCAKQPDIIQDELLQGGDIVCFNETHLNKTDVLTPEMFGFDKTYALYRCDRGSNGGGVLVLVHKKLHPHLQKVSSPLEAVVLHVVKNDHEMYIISVYRPPHSNVSMWCNEISKILKLYNSSPVCVLGDFNEDIMLDPVCGVKSMFSSYGFVQHVHTPTRDSGTLIDHVYTKNIQIENVCCDVCDCYYSDHDIVSCVIKC